MEPPNPVSDDEIERRIEAALAYNPTTDAFQIDVQSERGKVILTGGVETFFEKAQAGSTATGIRGVTTVDNRLEVRRPTKAYVFNHYLGPRDPYVEAWKYVSPTAVTSDMEIGRNIERQLIWSPFVDAEEVRVGVLNGNAILTGTVDSWSEYHAATENALEGGAIAVYNQLKVE